MLVGLLAVATIWQVTPVAEWLSPRQVALFLRAQCAPLQIAIVIGAFVAGGLLVTPLNLLNVVTIIALGPWYGAGLAYLGALASGAVLFVLGRRLGRVRLEQALHGRAARWRELIVDKGVLAVASVRLVPVAPYTVVNLAAGAIGVTSRDFMLGTMLGLLPGKVLLALLADRVEAVLRHPTLVTVLALAGALLLAALVTISIRRLLSRRRSEGRAQAATPPPAGDNPGAKE